MRYRIAGLLIPCGAFLAFVLAGCSGGGGPSEPPEPTIEGTYLLRSVFGTEIPALARFGEDGCLAEVEGGRIVFRSDQTFTWTETRTGQAETCAGETFEYETSGSFTLSGGSVSFSEPRLLEASWSGDVVVLTRRQFGLLSSEPEDVVRTYRR